MGIVGSPGIQILSVWVLLKNEVFAKVSNANAGRYGLLVHCSAAKNNLRTIENAYWKIK